MVQAHYSLRIYQHIATPLVDIVGRLMQLLPLQQLPGVDPPTARPPQIKKGSLKHAVVRVHLPLCIHQQRPVQAGLSNVLAGKEVVFEGNNGDLEIQPVKFCLPITQLRDVRAAGESTQVAVKHHQQPAAAKIGKLVRRSAGISKVETESRFAGQVIHGCLLGQGSFKLLFGSLDGLLALDLVLVIGCAGHPVETLLPVGRAGVVLVALLPLLLLKAGVPAPIGTARRSKAEDD